MFGRKKKQKGIVTKIITEEKYKWAYLDKDGVDNGNLLGFGRKIDQIGKFDETITYKKDEWICLDKDGVDIGGVAGSDEKEAIINFVNCAVGASIFDRPVCALVRGDTRLDVSQFVVFIRMKETGTFTGLNFMDKGLKNISEIIDIGLKLYHSGYYEGSISCYNWVLRMDSQNVDALKNKALTYDAIGK